MKILLIGSYENWMGIHLRQFAKAFELLGHSIGLVDYGKLERSRIPFGFSEKTLAHRRHRNLKKIVNQFRPAIMIFVIARPRFDFAIVREFFDGCIIVHDYDGPAWKCYRSLEWLQEIDLLCTVSQVSRRELNKKGFPCVYLPHGVDVDYYRPLQLGEQERARYGSTISFVGRPTPRRIRMLEAISDLDLTLWGRRWSKKSHCPNPNLRELVRSPRDIFNEGVVKIYSATDLFVNMLREPLHDPPTIMSLQVFAVPSCGTCLLTEWVEELEAAFEPGKELLVFHTEDEFRELVHRAHRDKKTLQAIGAAGRKRCKAEHTHLARAAELLRLLK